MYGSDVSEDYLEHFSTLSCGDLFRKHELCCRFKQKAPWPWLAITTSVGILVIASLVGYIFQATMNRIAKVEDDYHKMMKLKKQVEAADVAESQFLATVSHEIRIPTNGVLGMLHMLMDTDLDETQQDYVRTTQESGKALVSLINEVLDQAKIESDDGEKAIALLRPPHDFDVCFMDIQMPGMDGFEATKEFDRWNKLREQGIPTGTVILRAT